MGWGMPVDAILINQPAIDFAALLGFTSEALGYNIAAKSDTCGRRLSDAEKFVSCLAALRDPDALPGLRPNLLNQVSFSVLVIAEAKDVKDILEAASTLPFVRKRTKVRGVEFVILHGTLAQWRDAVISGTHYAQAQACYCKIAALFEGVGLNVWRDCNRNPSPNGLFQLEDKRERR